MSDYSEMFEGYDDVEASYGFVDEPLPSGWYPLKVEKILDAKTSKNGAPMVRVQLLVTEGDCANKRCFTSVTLGASRLDKDGAIRTEAEIKDASKKLKPIILGFLSSIGVTTGQPVGTGDQAVYAFFNVPSWEGREFMGYIKKLPAKGDYEAQNRLNGYRPIDDPKQGIAAWRAGKSSKGVEVKAETI